MIAMRRKGLFILSFIFLLLTLSACKDTAANLTKIPDSEQLLYATNAPVNKEDIGEKIGSIEKKVNSEADLVDWSSMDLKEGTEIYLLKDHETSEIKYAYKKGNTFHSFSPYTSN